MATLVILIVLAQFLLPAQQQVSSANIPPVEVLEVEVLMREVKATNIRPAPAPPPGPISATDIPGVRPKPDSREQPTISERSRDLREIGSRRDRQSVPVRTADRYIYYYRVRLKNNSPKKIKSILWEYQLLDGSASTILSQRIFFCAVSIKSQSIKELQPGAYAPPNRVVSADNPDDPAQKQRVVVNQIEYSDGSKWMRDGWTEDDLTRIDTTKKVRDIRDNQCALL